MNFKFIKPAELDRNLKATIHKSGKIGFTVEAAKKLKLETDKGIMVALNEDNKEDKNLYVLVIEKHNLHSFRVAKAGGYYYVNTKDLFDNLNIDYTGGNIVFDIRDMKINEADGFVFKRRDSENEKKEE